MGKKEDHNTPLLLCRMRQDVHEIVSFEGAFEDAHGRETVPVFVEGMRVEIRPFRRTHAPLPQTHGRQAVPVQTL